MNDEKNELIDCDPWFIAADTQRGDERLSPDLTVYSSVINKRVLAALESKDPLECSVGLAMLICNNIKRYLEIKDLDGYFRSCDRDQCHSRDEIAQAYDKSKEPKLTFGSIPLEGGGEAYLKVNYSKKDEKPISYGINISFMQDGNEELGITKSEIEELIEVEFDVDSDEPESVLYCRKEHQPAQEGKKAKRTEQYVQFPPESEPCFDQMMSGWMEENRMCWSGPNDIQVLQDEETDMTPEKKKALLLEKIYELGGKVTMAVDKEGRRLGKRREVKGHWKGLRHYYRICRRRIRGATKQIY